jgi:hypothetical protein
MQPIRDFEKEQRERVLRYQHRNAELMRLKARNKYRIKHNIPLDAPVLKRKPIQYP